MTRTNLAVLSFLCFPALGCGDEGGSEHVPTPAPVPQPLTAQKACVEIAANICERRLECTVLKTGERIEQNAANSLFKLCVEGLANGKMRCGTAKQVAPNYDACLDAVVDARCVYTREGNGTQVDISIPSSCEGAIRS